MKILKHLLLIFLVALPFTGIFAQAPKFGHIDMNALFMVMPEYSAIQKTLDDETSKLESQLTVMREELTKLEIEFEKTAATLTPQEQEQKRTEYTQNMGSEACRTLVEISILAGDPVYAGIVTAVEHLPAGELESSENVLQIHKNDMETPANSQRVA